jgi:hypothetical protein
MLGNSLQVVFLSSALFPLILSQMASTTMAAALAASLPAPQTAPTPAAPTYEAIPASMSKVIDIEAEIPLTCVQLDGLVIRLVFVLNFLI